MTKRLPQLARRPSRWAMLLSLGLVVAMPLPAQAAGAALLPPIERELRVQNDVDLLTFYATRAYRPLWLTPEGALDPAARTLLALVETADLDGLDSSGLRARELAEAIHSLDQQPSPAHLARVDLTISRIYAAYVAAMQQAPAAAMLYEHESLQPRVARVADALYQAATAPSLMQHVSEMRWMHPLYVDLRRQFGAGQVTDPAARRAVLSNLARLRALPATPRDRYVLVDAASARLWMYEGRQPVDSMRVVVGKAGQQTPLMAGYIRHAVVNPYWNVPTDLVRSKIAPKVLSRGAGYLKSAGYEVMSDWTDEATVVNPATLDWKKIARGEVEARVRQLPGPGNSMGKVKYEFPNKQGIYLHDTPDKSLMRNAARQLSSGCIRLEDAERLGRWLLQAPIPEQASGPEQKVNLPEPVPIYVTYLTTRVENGQLALGADPYSRDAVGGSPMIQAAMAGLAGQ